MGYALTRTPIRKQLLHLPADASVCVPSARQVGSVNPSVGSLGCTITATGAGFQAGAGGLVLGGGLYISVNTSGMALGESQ